MNSKTTARYGTQALHWLGGETKQNKMKISAFHPSLSLSLSPIALNDLTTVVRPPSEG